MEMKKYKLGEIATIQTGPFGSQLHNEDYVLKGTPIVTVEHLGNKYFTTQNLPLVSDEDKERLKKYLLKENDIVFSRVGSVDRCSFVSEKETGWLFSGRCLRVRPNKEFVNSQWLYYFFSQQYFKDYVRSKAVGCTMPSLNTDLLSNLVITTPPLPTQQKIAAVLSALDDKIALNRRINAKLEQMAKRLYDYWFVQFDFPFDFAQGKPNADGKPYKASGGKMVWNEVLKREIPAGWEVKRLGDIIIEIPKSKIQVNQVKNEGDIPFFTSGENILKTDKPLTNGAKIFLSTGGNAVIKLYVGDAAYSTDTYCIEFDEYTFYIYLLLKSMTDYINTNLFTGSGLKHLQKEQFKSLYCVLPPKQLLKSFNRLVSTSYTHISRNTLQQEKLTALRDRLLPLLMNGQVEVE